MKKLTEEHKKKISESLINRKRINFIPWNKGIPQNEETKRKLSESLKKAYQSEELRKKVSDATRKAMADPAIRKKIIEGNNFCSSERRLKNSESHKKLWQNPEYRRRQSLSHKGKKHTEEHKAKIRAHALNRTKTNGTYISIGKNETALLNLQELKDGRKIKRNYPIKPLGYVVDGYCEETNTVYEVYEKYHDKQVGADLNRENQICRKLGCDFIIIYDNRGSAW